MFRFIFNPTKSKSLKLIRISMNPTDQNLPLETVALVLKSVSCVIRVKFICYSLHYTYFSQNEKLNSFLIPYSFSFFLDPLDLSLYVQSFISQFESKLSIIVYCEQVQCHWLLVEWNERYLFVLIHFAHCTVLYTVCRHISFFPLRPYKPCWR